MRHYIFRLSLMAFTAASLAACEAEPELNEETVKTLAVTGVGRLRFCLTNLFSPAQ